MLTLRASGYQAFYWSTLLVAVANGLVDAATNNTTGLAFYRTGTPEARADRKSVV